MFDDFLRRLRRLELTEIAVPLQSDSEGYFDKECPNDACLFQFKVFGEDWTNLCNEEVIHCPLCGHQAPSKSWWSKEQIEGARRQAFAAVKATIRQRLFDGTKNFNRKQKTGLVTMSMKFSGKSNHHTIIPIAAQDAMKLKIRCDSCSTRFAVVGSAFFCPCCGANSVERTFDDSLKKVDTKLDNLDAVRSALENLAGKDSAELTCRSLVETGLNDCVVAFQKLMESLYMQIPGIQRPPLNTFQRLDEGSKFWKQATGESYDEWISKGDLIELNTLFHKRHLLAHTEGFVDERYLQKTGDTSYRAGQRIVVREKDVRRLVELVRLITREARSKKTDMIEQI